MKAAHRCHNGVLKTLTNNASTDTFAKARVVDQNYFRNGEGGIRTHDGLRHNCLAGSPVQPLLHLSIMAVGVGFEPTMACAITVFKTAAFVHSAIPPMFHSSYYLNVYIIQYLGYFVKLIFSFRLSISVNSQREELPW